MSTRQSLAHDTVVWTKQRLDELDAIISEAEKSAADLKDQARKDADDALARLRASRDKIAGYAESLRAEVADLRQEAADVQDKLDAEWVEVETALQSYLGIIRDKADSVYDLVSARVKAQRKSLQDTLDELRAKATANIEEAQKEVDAAITVIADETQKIEARLGDIKSAGSESWDAVKAGVAEARAAHERTIRKIKDAFSALV